MQVSPKDTEVLTLLGQRANDEEDEVMKGKRKADRKNPADDVRK